MKGISKVELHFEKVALGLLAVAIGSLLVLDFLNPTSIKMGNDSNVSPQTANSLLKEKAIKLKALQDSTENPLNLNSLESGAATKTFVEKLTADISPGPKIRVNTPSFAQEIMNPNVKFTNTWFYEPHFPAAVMVSPVAWFSDALEPDASSKNESLQKFLATHSTPDDLDVIWTKPTARVNLKFIRDELAKADRAASPPKIATPSTWRNNAIYFIDVVFQRQEQQPDGSWGDPTDVPVMFGFESTTLRNRDLKSLDSEKIFAAMRAPSAEKEIRQPDFYPTLYKNGGATQTDETRSTDGEAKKKQQATVKQKEQLEELEKELKAKESQLQTAGGEWDKEIGKKEDELKKQKKQKNKKDIGTDTAPPPSGSEGTSSDLNLRKKLTPVVRDLRTKILKLKKELGIEIPKLADVAAAKPVQPIEVDLDFIDVWTHDLTATPGKTFRYRCRVDLFNPFFGKERQLVPEQKKLASSPFISSEVGVWSDPVRVPTKVMYFAESGTLGDKGVKQAAVFSAYILKDGLWQSINPSPSFEVGQPILFSLVASQVGKDTTAQFEFLTEWFVADIFEDLNAMPEKSRPTLPAVVLGRQDQSGKFVIHYCTQEKLDPEQATLKKLVEQGKNAPPPAKPAS